MPTIQKYGFQTYNNVCLLLSILLVSYSIYEYTENNDVSRVDYEQFHATTKDIYPSISLCFGDVFSEDALLKYGTDPTSYKRFLKGEISNETFLQIKYQDVTKDLTDYLLAIETVEEKYNGVFDGSTFHISKQDLRSVFSAADWVVRVPDV